MKKVSIVVPVYNVERYLQQCVESLIHQTYTDLEILLVDDGSTDQSGQMCDEYAEKDERIKVIHQQNAGAANAKNAGIDAATGEYLTFIDSDDYVDLDWVACMVETLENNHTDLVECGLDQVYKDRVCPVDGFEDGNGYFATVDYLKIYFQKWTNSLFCNKLFKRTLTDGIRFRTERRCIDDEYYTYKILCNASSVFRIGRALYHYRQRRSSAVQSPQNKLQITDDALEIMIERYEWIVKRIPELKHVFLEHDIDFLLYFCYQGTYDKDLVKKYRRVAWYYLRKSLGYLSDKVMIVNWFRLLRRYPPIGDKTKAVQPEEGLFD